MIDLISLGSVNIQLTSHISEILSMPSNRHTLTNITKK